MEKRDYNLKALSILVVEDSDHMGKLLTSVLQLIGVGYTVVAKDGKEAPDLYRVVLPDIIITDGAMEPMDGYEFTRRLRMDRSNPNPFVPVIMLSGHLEKVRVEKARDCGVTEYLAKPISMETLNDRIISVIERPRMFVRTSTYFGPDRRRRLTDIYFGKQRRWTRNSGTGQPANGVDFINPPNYLLAKVSKGAKRAVPRTEPKTYAGSRPIDTEQFSDLVCVVNTAKTSLSGLIQEEIAHIKSLFWLVEDGNPRAVKELFSHMSELRALATTPEYEPVSRISDSLCKYLASLPDPAALDPGVLRPHIDALVCIFMKGGQAGGDTESVVAALQRLASQSLAASY